MRMIWFSWSLLSRPRNSGTPEIILQRFRRQPAARFKHVSNTHSAMMHPALQTSMLVE